MSLLMEALKKAERTKQEQATPHAEPASQPDAMAETSSPLAAPVPEISLLPREKTTGHVEALSSSDFPAILPDLPSPPSADQDPPPAHTKPAAPALELTLAAYDLSSASADKKSEPPGGAYDLSSASADRKSESPGAEPAPLRGTSVNQAPLAAPDSEAATRAQAYASKPPAAHAEARPEALPLDARNIAAAQHQAKAVFAAKQPARNRTRRFAVAIAALTLGLVGFGIYYWQMTSPITLLLPAGTPHPAAPAVPVDPGTPQQPAAPTQPAQSPADKPVPSPAQETTPASALARPVTASGGPARAEARNETESLQENPAIRIRRSAATNQLNPALGKAYLSFLSGDTGTAQQLYHKVLQQEPNNRDALLGMAAIAMKHNQAGQAAAYYGKLIELDPADPDALAGLIGVQGQSDPAQSESRLKKVLAQNPQSDAAHFALGNLYFQQSRWAEAQQAFFRAYSSAPGNADYAFNLAVSLDHLNQGKLALDYYQRALAQPGPTNFDKASAQTRIRELMQAAGN